MEIPFETISISLSLIKKKAVKRHLEAGMEKRRDWTRGAASGGGRRRGRVDDGAAGRSDALAVDIKERDREPERKAISVSIGI